MSRGGGEVETNGAHYGIAINFSPGWELAVIAAQTDQLTLAIRRLKMATPLWVGLDGELARSNYWFWQRRRRLSVARALNAMGAGGGKFIILESGIESTAAGERAGEQEVSPRPSIHH